jgi:tetratricopeptide (TPR) repeat protein
MGRLSASNRFHLKAAQGWLGLGNWKEANEELDRVTQRLRAHPEVLCVRWIISSKAGNWELALEITRTLADQNPDDSFSFVRLGWSLFELNRIQEAQDSLTAVVSRFPNDYRLPYDLARYSCKLGKLKEAMQ